MMISPAPLSPNNIREKLHQWVNESFSLSEHDILINELGFYNKDPLSTVDNAFRADLVLATNRLVGFEIKSEKDTLKRWTAQMLAYSNVFDEVWLCVHSKHIEKSIQVTPKHIGILMIDSFGSIAIVRSSTQHKKNNIYDLSSMLWKDELIELACKYNLNAKSKMTKRQIRALLSERLTMNQVCDFTIGRLKVRKTLLLE